MNLYKKNKSYLNSKVYINAAIESITQFNPFSVVKNPVLFLVEVCLIIMIFLCVNPNLFGPSELTKFQNIMITSMLFLTILFSNFAENVAKNLGKVQAESLRIVHGDIEVKKVNLDGIIEYVFTSQLKKDDIIKVQEGDLIPLDGEVIDGIASIDESAITGESSPVLKEPGTDVSSTVTGGTRVLTDWLMLKVTSEQGETFVDQMLYMTQETERHKTPNEVSLNATLIASTITCLLSVLTLAIIINYLKLKIEIPFLITLLICLIPTTISSLLVPITVSGFDKINLLNILAISRKSIESCGDINYLFLDKTGTITYGNRMAIEFIPVGSYSIKDIAKFAYLSSFYDQTPEGKSIVSLAKRYGINIDKRDIKGIPHEFSAHTRMSGIDLESGEILRKGAVDAIIKLIIGKGGAIDPQINALVEKISIQGGTPLLISSSTNIIGLINLKDMVKGGIKGFFEQLKGIGVTTIMCTGDNSLTAKVIAEEAGIEKYISQAKPEDKIKLIKELQDQGMMVAMIGDGTNDAPALAQADIGLAMNNGTSAAKEAANMIDLDSDPTKIINIIKIGRQLLATRGALTTFSIINDTVKYFALLPSLVPIAAMEKINLLRLECGFPAVISALIFNTIIIPAMTPIAINGVKSDKLTPNEFMARNMLIFGVGAVLIPLVFIKIINVFIGGLT